MMDEFYDEFDLVQSAAKREREGEREGDRRREMVDDGLPNLRYLKAPKDDLRTISQGKAQIRIVHT